MTRQLTIDLNPAFLGYAVREDLLETRLESAGLLDETNIYRAIPWHEQNRITVQKHGTDKPHRETVMAFDHDEVFGSYPARPSLFFYLEEALTHYDSAAILVYDVTQFFPECSTEFPNLRSQETWKAHPDYPGYHGSMPQNIYPFRNPKKRKSALRAIIRVKEP